MNVTLEHLYPTLNRQKRETRKAHMAFLLWAVQDPERRSIRLAARALGKSESLFRRWSHRWGWKDRLLGVDQPDIVVLCFLRSIIKAEEADAAEAIRGALAVAMPQSSLLQNLNFDQLQDKLADGIVLSPRVVTPPQAHLHVNLNQAPEPVEPAAPVEPKAEEPAPPGNAQIIMAPPGATALPDQEEVEEDFRQMRKLIALGRAYILGQLRERKVRVTMGDILTLQKAAFLMYGGPTESLAIDFTGLNGTGGGRGPVGPAAEAYSVKLARESGDKDRYVAALRADLDEQAALIGAIAEASGPPDDVPPEPVDEPAESAAK